MLRTKSTANTDCLHGLYQSPFFYARVDIIGVILWSNCCLALCTFLYRKLALCTEGHWPLYMNGLNCCFVSSCMHAAYKSVAGVRSRTHVICSHTKELQLCRFNSIPHRNCRPECWFCIVHNSKLKSFSLADQYKHSLTSLWLSNMWNKSSL